MKKKKILFLIQEPNKGGLSNLTNRWKNALIKDFSVDQKVIRRDHFKFKKYDLIHLFFSPFYSKKLFFRLLFNKFFNRKVKVVLTYYNLKEESKFKKLFRKVLIFFTSDYLALPSERMVKHYSSKFSKNVFLLHPLIPEEYAKYQKKEKKNISYFGALREDKGISNLIKISKFLPEKIHSAGFEIGSKISKSYFKKISKNERFILEKEDYLKLISESKLVLFPYLDLSSTIDMPLALLESMKMGSPVLASNISPLNTFLPTECLVSNWSNKSEVLRKIKFLEKNQKKVSKKLIKILEELNVDSEFFLKNYKSYFFENKP